MTKLTLNDKAALKGLCQYPYHYDREIGKAVGVNLSTMTACRNKMRKLGIFQRFYVPAYHRLGYSLVSFSQIRLTTIPDLKHILKDKDKSRIISMVVRDPLNCLIIAYHRDYLTYTRYIKLFEEPWTHDLFIIGGAKRVVNFNFTNLVNRVFFPRGFMSNKPITEHVRPYKFVNKSNKRVFDGLLRGPKKNGGKVGNEIGVSRQSVVKIRELFRRERILERTTVVVDLERIGINLMSVIRLEMDKVSTKDISKINKTLRPFYYWVFNRCQLLMTGHKEFAELTGDMEQVGKMKGLKISGIHKFDVTSSKVIYGFDRFSM